MLCPVSDTLRENALEPDEDERVRAGVQQIVRESGSQAAASRRIGVSQQTVSRHLSGFPAGKNLAAKVAAVLGVTPRQLLRGDEPTEEPQRPVFRNLPGWIDAEAEARRRYRHIPAEAFDAVGDLSGARVPDVVTADWIAQLASVYAMALRGEGQDVDPD